jgi:hypothetical protein
MATRGNRISFRRVATISVLLALAVAASMLVLAYRMKNSFSVVAEAKCVPTPSNIKHLSAPLSDAELAVLPPSDAISLLELRPYLQPGDTVHRFESGVTGGLIAIRGSCYVAQHASWIR